MEPVDVCIVCALPEEVRAFLEVVQPYCEGEIEEQSSSRYQYSYRIATIKNTKDERLHLHISWLARYGPQEMALHLSHVLEECQPRIAIMTGICAGDKEQVQLGDLVVAERTFTYDSGKFTLDKRGRQVHQHDILTYQLDAAILQFLGLFDAWKPLVAALPRPAAPPDTKLEEREVRRYLKAMASGSAVRADQPFADVQVPVRGTAAIDMEGAAFALAASLNHHTPWLVIKGVCDYADGHKGDAYHDFAARASALYALSFIQHYMIHERPLRRNRSDHLWRVPHARNPHFTGRDAILASLRQMLVPGAKVTALTQAISGLGGIGKTQVAVEYAHRYADVYKVVLWAQADSPELLTTEYLALATVLGLPAQQEAAKQVEAVKHWLQTNRGWLLILDNVEKPRDILPSFLPSKHEGSVLITTRRRDIHTLAHSEVLPVFEEDEGILFLLHRAGRIAPEAPVTDATESDYHHTKELCALLGWLPLALDQAGAYITENGVSFARYLELYRQSQQKLLDRRGDADHPDSVFMTFWLSWDAIQQRNALAGTILQFCAFLAPDQIPESLVCQAIAHVETTDPPETIVIDEALGLLYRYSLIERADQTLSLHRLVQDVIREVLSEEERQQWMERAVLEVDAIFPDGDYETWPQCEFLLPHALTCAEWIKGLRRMRLEGGRLCNNAGRYLRERGLYEATEPLLRLAMRIVEQQLGSTYPETAIYLNDLAMLYHAQGKYEQAEPLYQRALYIREQQLGSTHLETSMSLNNLAMLYYHQGKYEQAESLYQRVLSIAEQQLGPSHPGIAIYLNNLAMLYQAQGKYEQAEPLYQQALSIAEQQLGPEHPEIAASLNNLAELYRAQGKYEQAEPLYQQALSIAEQQLGPDHPQTAVGLNNLAELYHAQGEYEQAEALLQQALFIDERQLGPDHPHTATSLNNLAMLYRAQGKYEQAKPLYRRALSINEQQLGPTHPETATSLNNLAGLYHAQGKYEEAEPLLQRAFSIREQQLGPDNPGTAISLNDLAMLYHAQGKYEEAEPLYQRALSIFEHQLGPEHPHTATSLDNLAALYYVQGEYKQAESLLQQALCIREQRLGSAHPETAMSLNNLAELYRAQGKYEKAEPLLRRALSISEQQLGPDHPYTSANLNNLAGLYRAQGKYGQAEPLYQRAIEICVASLGREHPQTQQVVSNYALVKKEMGGDPDALP